MTIALVNATRGSINTTTGGFDEPIDLPAGASIALGNHLILVAAYDNSSLLGGDPNMFVASSAAVGATAYVDLRGNVWTRLALATNSSLGTDTGTVVDIWISRVQFAYLNGDDITLQFSFTTPAVVARVSEWSGIRPVTYPIVGPISGTGSSTVVGPVGTVTPTAVGQLVIGAGSTELGSASFTGDADVTGGAWVTLVNTTVGAGGAGQTLFSQYKIVTTTAAQDWDATKVGTDDWAALALVLDDYVPANPEFPAGNPNSPCLLGFEGLPTETTSVGLDTGTGYLFEHTVLPDSIGTQDYTMGSEFRSARAISQHAVAYDLYKPGAELIQDEITTVVLPLRTASLSGGAVVSGGGTALAALSTVGGAFVVVPVGGVINLNFQPAELQANFLNSRILRWGIRYVAWKDDGASATPSEGFDLTWRDAGSNNGFGSDTLLSAWLVPNYRRDSRYETRWIGEINPSPRGKGLITATNLKDAAPFSVFDLTEMDGSPVAGATTLVFTGRTAQINFDYFEAVIELAPERREASGIRLLSNAPGAGAPFAFSFGGSPLFAALNSSNRYRTTQSDYVMVVREAEPASPADYYRAQGSGQALFGTTEAAGPSLQLLGYTTPRATLEPQPTLTRAAISNGTFVGMNTEFDQYTLSAVAYDAGNVGLDGPFWPGYRGLGPNGAIQIYTGMAKRMDLQTSGGALYDRIKVLAKPDSLTTGVLTITLEQPLATVLNTVVLTPDQVRAGIPAGSGWFEISVPLSAPGALATGQAYLIFTAASTVTNAAPWYVAAAEPDGGLNRFGYNPDAVNGLTSPWDYAAVLQCTLALPSLALSSASALLLRAADRCVSSTLEIPQLLVSNAALYDRLVAERSIDGGRTWTAIRSGLRSDAGPWLRDTFSRTSVSGWGTADLSSGAWTNASGTATDFTVSAGLGRVASPTTNINRRTYLASPSADVEIYGEISVPEVSSGASVFGYLMTRATADIDNAYLGRLDFATTGLLNVSIRSRVASVETSLSTLDGLFSYAPGDAFSVRFRTVGELLQLRVWRKGSEEPTAWTREITNVALTSANNIGTRSLRNTGNTNVLTSVFYDNIEVSSQDVILDYGVPWDVSPVLYRVTGYRDFDRRAAVSAQVSWAGAPASAPGLAFGLADPEGSLILAYTPAEESSPSTVWNALDPIEIVPLHGVDLQVALRSPERRGLSVSAAVVVDHLTACTTGVADAYGEFVGRGGFALTPVPYDLLRAAERLSRLALQLPGGHTRYVSLDLGPMTIRTQNGVYLAEILLTDVVPPEADPYSVNA